MGMPDHYINYEPVQQAYEGDTLTLEGKEFRLGGYKPSIFFTNAKLTIGCKSVTAEAMDRLVEMWQEFRKCERRKVIQ